MGLLRALRLVKAADPEPPKQAPQPERQPRTASFSLDLPQEITGLPAIGGVAPRISRREALQVPAVMRARNLICGPSTLPIRVHAPDMRVSTRDFVPGTPDPDIPKSVVYAQTFEDLFFEGIAWWRVTAFGWHGFPVAARHVPVESVHIAPRGSSGFLPSQNLISPDQPWPIDGDVYIDGIKMDDREVIRFDSPNPPLLVHAARAIRTCLLLDQAAALYAKSPMPLAWFESLPGADQLEQEEITVLLDAWEEARRERSWGYVGGMTAKTLQWNPEQLQLADQRQHAVLEIARAAGIDPEDLGVSTTSRTYQNGETRRQDMLDFTLGLYVSAVQDRLSMRDVVPPRYTTRIDFAGFLRSDTKTRMETYKLGLEVGAYTPEEVRELEHRPPIRQQLPVRRQPAVEPAPEMAANGVELADRGNIDTPDAGDLNAAARQYATSRGWAMRDGAYPIRPANMHGREDLSKAIRAVGRGGAPHDAIRRHIMKRARSLGAAEALPDNWQADGSVKASVDWMGTGVAFTDSGEAISFDAAETHESFRVNAEKRTISGLVVPWGKVARSGFSKWRFVEGSLRWVAEARVKLNIHHTAEFVGVAVRLQSTSRGLDASFKIARGPEGDKALSLAEDGVLDGFSIEVDFEDESGDDWQSDPTDESVRLVRSAKLRGVALTAMPAFDDARVAAVAATRSGKETTVRCTLCGHEHAPEVACATAPTTAPAVPAAAAAAPAAPAQFTLSNEQMQAFTVAQGEAIVGAIREAFERLPMPQYDPGAQPVPAGRAPVTVTREAPVYAFTGNGPSFVRDVWNARVEGNADANERLRKYRAQQQEMVNLFASRPDLAFAVNTGNASAVIPPGYRPDLYVTQLLQGRPLFDAVSKGTLTDATPFTLPKFVSASGATGDHVEGTNPTGGSMVITTTTVTPGGISGKYELTREIIDSSNPAIDQIAFMAMRESYSQQCEAKIYAELNGANGQGGVITNGFVPSGAQVSTTAGAGNTGFTALIAGARAALALYPFRRFGEPNRMHLSQEATSAFAQATGSDGRPLLPSVGAQNTVGVGNALTQGWFVDGLAALPTWSMTGNAAGDADLLGFNSMDVWAWESPLLTFRFEEKNGPANIELALFAYFATRILRPVSLFAIRHTAA